MRLGLLALALLPLTAATKPVAVMPTKSCLQHGPQKVDARQPVRVTTLHDMPPADQMLAVYRSVDGCPTPVLVRQNVGEPRR